MIEITMTYGHIIWGTVAYLAVKFFEGMYQGYKKDRDKL